VDAEFNWQTVVRFAGGTVVWGLGIAAVATLLHRLGLRPFWLLFPVSALLATLLGYAVRLPNIYPGRPPGRMPNFRVWLVQQLATWTLICLTLWFLRAYTR
jgi:hypothetical protein